MVAANDFFISTDHMMLIVLSINRVIFSDVKHQSAKCLYEFCSIVWHFCLKSYYKKQTAVHHMV